jgi:hypothetical protein
MVGRRTRGGLRPRAHAAEKRHLDSHGKRRTVIAEATITERSYPSTTSQWLDNEALTVGPPTKP